jgi:hypothetical protein
MSGHVPILSHNMLIFRCFCASMFSFGKGCWCPGAELNHRHADFQSAALPTELPGHFRITCGLTGEPSLSHRESGRVIARVHRVSSGVIGKISYLCGGQIFISRYAATVLRQASWRPLDYSGSSSGQYRNPDCPRLLGDDLPHWLSKPQMPQFVHCCSRSGSPSASLSSSEVPPSSASATGMA